MNWDKTANELDSTYQKHCQDEVRVNEDGRPWLGAVEADLGLDRLSRYYIGNHLDTNRRIVPITHFMAEAYFLEEPGSEVSAPRGTAKVVWKGAIKRSSDEIEAIDFRHREGLTPVVKKAGAWVVGDPGQASKDLLLSNVLALLTPEQFLLVKTPEDIPLIVEGRAGSGKTSVALYRLKYLLTLREEAPATPQAEQGRFLIVMFNPSLVRYVSHLTEQAGMGGLELVQFYDWAEARIRDAYKGELARDPRSTTRPGRAVAERLKKRIEILRAVDQWLDAQEARVPKFLQSKLDELRHPDETAVFLSGYAAHKGPLVRRLAGMRTKAKEAREDATGLKRDLYHQIYRVFDNAVDRLTRYKEELLRILTDRTLLRAAFPHESDSHLEALINYQKAVQGEGASPKRPGPYIGPGDQALLLHVIRRKNGGYPLASSGAPFLYDHILVDEAQDFGAAELSVLLGSVKDRRHVTIAGDANQQVMPDVEFGGWARIASELGIKGVKVHRLRVSHRSSSKILRLANIVLGVEEAIPEHLEGDLPRLWSETSEAHAKQRVYELVQEMMAAQPEQHIAVIARNEDLARQILAGVPPEMEGGAWRKGTSHSFEFKPGVTVTSVAAAKGLEFDVVVLFSPSPAHFGDDHRGRRHLYTAITRARTKLEVVVVGDDLAVPLQRGVEQGALQGETIVELKFDEEGDGVL